MCWPVHSHFVLEILKDWPMATRRFERALGHPITKDQWAGHMHMAVGDLDAQLHEAELARDRMVMANLRLVVSVVKQYNCEGLEVPDLIQVRQTFSWSLPLVWWTFSTLPLPSQSMTILHRGKLELVSLNFPSVVSWSLCDFFDLVYWIYRLESLWHWNKCWYAYDSQEGSIGLLKGVEKFDHTRGYKLSTYVHWWIRQVLQLALSTSKIPTCIMRWISGVFNEYSLVYLQGVTRAIADHSRTVRLPVHVHDTLGRIRRTRARMLQDGAPATVQVKILSCYCHYAVRELLNITLVVYSNNHYSSKKYLLDLEVGCCPILVFNFCLLKKVLHLKYSHLVLLRNSSTHFTCCGFLCVQTLSKALNLSDNQVKNALKVVPNCLSSLRTAHLRRLTP